MEIPRVFFVEESEETGMRSAQGELAWATEVSRTPKALNRAHGYKVHPMCLIHAYLSLF